MALTAAASPSSLPPVFHRAVRGQQRTDQFVASHDDLQQFLGSAARRTEKQWVFVAGDEGAGGHVEDQAAIHLLIEGSKLSWESRNCARVIRRSSPPVLAPARLA